MRPRPRARRRVSPEDACFGTLGTISGARGGAMACTGWPGSTLAGPSLFDSERANIEAAQIWAASHRRQSPSCRLCFEFAGAGAYVLDLRLPRRSNPLARGCRRRLSRGRRPSQRGRRAGQSRLRIGGPKRAAQSHRAARAAARGHASDWRPSGREQRVGQLGTCLEGSRRNPEGHRMLRRATRDRRAM